MLNKNNKYFFYAYIALVVIGAIAFLASPHIVPALMLLGGGYGIYHERTNKRPAQREVERKVRECLRLTANENIHRAKNHESEPVSFFDRLRSEFGEKWVLALNEKQISWMRDAYDEMIASYTGEQMELSKRRAALEDFGASEQRQLSSYFRGKEEQSQIQSGNYNAADGVNWDRLVAENKDDKGDVQNS